MRRLTLFVLLFVCTAAQAQVKIAQLPTGLMPLKDSWRFHAGDDPAWADPGFDDHSWQALSKIDPGQIGTQPFWYRVRLDLPADRPPLAVFLTFIDGSCEAYVNGQRVDGIRFEPWWLMKGPVGQTFPIAPGAGPVTLALRFHPPVFDAVGWSANAAASLGFPDGIKAAANLNRARQFLRFVPSAAINLVIFIAGIGVMLLFLAQRRSPEYFWLGLYLLLLGSSFSLFSASSYGIGPGTLNDLYADPAIFLFTIAQIEFTYAFILHRPGRIWRVYEAILLSCLLATVLNVAGLMNSSVYYLLESLAVLPAAFALPVLLLFWYRRGNREAGWLILPSLFPAAGIFVTNLDPVGRLFGRDFSFMTTPVRLWATVPLTIYDLFNASFLLAIGVVLFFRFTRVNREQARTAAELNAAREIQQQLVPVHLPEVAGCRIETAYLPANEVGGDFYQVFEQPDGSSLIVVGDVSGKGLKAAMTGALALGALRTLASEGLGPGALLSRLNRQMLYAQSGGFITCLCARIALDGQVTVANAGHLPPYRNGSEVEPDYGLPLGVAIDAAYTETTFSLAPGDRLTLLSDGVVEARNPAGELYGFQRTAAISTEGAENIARAAQAFGQEDDITVLTLIYAGHPDRSLTADDGIGLARA